MMYDACIYPEFSFNNEKIDKVKNFIYRSLFEEPSSVRMLALVAIVLCLVSSEIIYCFLCMLFPGLANYFESDSCGSDEADQIFLRKQLSPEDMLPVLRSQMASGGSFEYVESANAQEMCDQRGQGCKNLNWTEHCPICLHDFECKGTIVRATCCAHVFHEDCMAMWFHRKKSCPCCRGTILDGESHVSST